MHIFGGIIKIPKPINKRVWLKMKPIQEVTNIASQLPTYCEKSTNKLGEVTNISRNTGFTFFFNYIFFEELLAFPNPQTTTFG